MIAKVPSVFQSQLLNFAPFCTLLIVWYFLTQTTPIDPIFLPPPGQVFSSFLQLFFSGDFILNYFLTSVFRVTTAFFLSVIIALPIGILCSQFTLASYLLEPIFGFTRYLPVAALAPLCILWFGIGDEQKIAVITFGVVFQLVLLFAFDTASIPHEFIEGGRTFGLNHWEIVHQIVLPWSMPAIWNDMRISAGWAWSYLVLAELVAGNNGLGYFIIQSQRYLQTEKVFAGILFVGILGALTDMLFRIIASKLFRWKSI
ncbi:ABC transporter permease [Anabaena sp. PCC 7108]|uniref:ABC transporter permease n=1 Tax=Anabaena sp. PCC 7108 TaxID=163908 RepID=UPI00034B9FF3|nr:ABC transporter permease [Anabaena sp. PCC 7108]